MARKSYDHLFKVLLIGDTAVGKTSLLHRFSDDTFTPSMSATIGIDFKVKTVVMNEKKVKLQVWDTAGQERFDTITTSYYRGADGIVLVYDLCNPDSFLNLAKWLRYIRQYADDGVAMILVGNKCDMVAERNVPKAKGEEAALEHSIPYFETSAKANLNVDDAFYEMTHRLLTRAADQPLEKTVKVSKRKRSRKGGCC
uniref:Ras-related protein Rab-1 n=1 Tax=Steinernema glaseri TaxID=37863 RepID=A0A1I7ZI37_9BILA